MCATGQVCFRTAAAIFGKRAHSSLTRRSTYSCNNGSGGAVSAPAICCFMLCTFLAWKKVGHFNFARYKYERMGRVVHIVGYFVAGLYRCDYRHMHLKPVHATVCFCMCQETVPLLLRQQQGESYIFLIIMCRRQDGRVGFHAAFCKIYRYLLLSDELQIFA